VAGIASEAEISAATLLFGLSSARIPVGTRGGHRRGVGMGTVARVIGGVMVALLIGSLPASPPASASTGTQSTSVPGPPTDTRAAAVIGRVHLGWNWPSPLPTDDDAVTGWIVGRRLAGGTWATLATTEGEQDHTDLSAVPGSAYEYRVRATGAYGHGAWGTPVAVAVPRTDLVGTHFGRLGVVARVAAYERLHEPGYGSVSRPAVSPDGRWTVVSQMVDTETVHLWRVPTYGTGTPSQLTSLPGLAVGPAWSPDGAQIAFTRDERDWDRAELWRSSVWVVPAKGGTPQRRALDAAEPAWDRDGSLIVTDLSEASLRLVRVGIDGTRRAIPGTADGRLAAVSPDGRLLAFTVPGSSTGPNDAPERDRALALLPLGTASTTPVVTQLEDGGYGGPTWHPDGRSLAVRYGQRVQGSNSVRHVYGLASLDLTSTSPPRVKPRTFVPDSGLVMPAYRSLGVHLTSAPARTGAAPRIGFGMHEPPEGTVFTCRLNDATAQACTSPWRGSGLPTGAHHLVVQSRDPSGQLTVTSHRWQVDATAPVVKVSGAGAVTLADRASVTYSATDADGIASYDVRYQRARFDRGFESWVRPDTWQATKATSRSIAVPRGYEYCFSVRARDMLGNTSAWSPSRCTSRPLDDPSLKASAGWTRATGTSFLDGTISRTTTRGAELTRAEVRAKRIWLVATRCATCGSVDVFVGSTRVGRVDLSADTTRRQQVIALPASTSVRSGKLTIRVTSSGKRVEIDGIAFRQS
jgi:hypothetical protein